MSLAGRARELKHLGLLASRRMRRIRVAGVNVAGSLVDRVRPPVLPPGRFAGNHGYFLDHDEPAPEPGTERTVPRVIWAFWTGDNHMTRNRRESLATIRSCNADLDVVVVTPENLPDFLVPGHPLHPAYRFLGAAHRADYLRCYFMHHHGGGYSDVKRHHTGWSPAWRHFEDPSVLVVGYQERSSDQCAHLPGAFGRYLRLHYSVLLGYGAFIARPDTRLTREWYHEVHRRLDAHEPALRECPGLDPYSGSPHRDNGRYPVRWTELGSQVFQPLQLKFLAGVRQDDRVLPDLSGAHR